MWIGEWVGGVRYVQVCLDLKKLCRVPNCRSSDTKELILISSLQILHLDMFTGWTDKEYDSRFYNTSVDVPYNVEDASHQTTNTEQ